MPNQEIEKQTADQQVKDQQVKDQQVKDQQVKDQQIAAKQTEVAKLDEAQLTSANLELKRPLTAYILLHFPCASETFIFREVQLLKDRLPLQVYTMYGEAKRGCSAEMLNCNLPIERFGFKQFPKALLAFARALKNRPKEVWQIIKAMFLPKMRSWEMRGENFLCFFFGFLLAEKIKADKIELLHAAWACGPATAAWIAAKLNNLPFSFSGHAGDIYPQDGLLATKAKDAIFIRANNQANVPYLQSFCQENSHKVHLVYNGLTLKYTQESQCPFNKTNFKLLAIGRFVETKGFEFLLTALARLRRVGLPISLTLIGDGWLKAKLKKQCQDLRISDYVQMPGFVKHDQLQNYLIDHDLLVMPSVETSTGDRDGIPNVIMEALSCRMPVIASDVCGIREVIVNEKTGLLVAQKDAKALDFAIQRLLVDRDFALKLAKAGQKHVQQMFDTVKNINLLAQIHIDSYAAYLKQNKQNHLS